MCELLPLPLAWEQSRPQRHEDWYNISDCKRGESEHGEQERQHRAQARQASIARARCRGDAGYGFDVRGGGGHRLLARRVFVRRRRSRRVRRGAVRHGGGRQTQAQARQGHRAGRRHHRRGPRDRLRRGRDLLHGTLLPQHLHRRHRPVDASGLRGAAAARPGDRRLRADRHRPGLSLGAFRRGDGDQRRHGGGRPEHARRCQSVGVADRAVPHARRDGQAGRQLQRKRPGRDGPRRGGRVQCG